MSDMEVTREELLTRAEAAERLATLAAALAGGEKVAIALGATRLEVHVPDQVRCEIELEVDGDEVELEVELRWSLGGRPAKGTPAAARVSRPGGRRGRGTAR
jgi:amphi-Trp domain-containing protein